MISTRNDSVSTWSTLGILIKLSVGLLTAPLLAFASNCGPQHEGPAWQNWKEINEIYDLAARSSKTGKPVVVWELRHAQSEPETLPKKLLYFELREPEIHNGYFTIVIPLSKCESILNIIRSKTSELKYKLTAKRTEKHDTISL